MHLFNRSSDVLFVSVCFLEQGSALEDSVAFFLSRNSAGEAAVRSTVWFASIWFMLQFGLGLIMLLQYGMEVAELVNFVPSVGFEIYWLFFDGLKTAFYLWALLHSISVGACVRSQATAYAAFNLFCYSLSLAGDILLSMSSD
jgi:hypothetical protein